jgi:pyruvate dehydrogenase E2 component (dihydrolipoamide acetyltransferase)
MLFADPSAVTRDMTDDMIKYKRLDGVEEALAAIRDRMVAGDDGRALASDLANISGPVHVIASKGDQIVGMPDKSALPANFKLHEIDDAGHMPHLEKAAEVNALLLAAVE